MKRIFAVAILFSSVILTNCARRDFSKSIRVITPSLVQVRSLVEHNDQVPHLDVKKSGSGVIVSSSGFIITNANIVVDEQNQKLKRIEVSIGKGEYLTARIVGIDMEKDLALIQARVTRADHFSVANFQGKDLVLGQIILKAGFPDAAFTDEPTFSQGIVTNTRVFLNNLSVPFIASDVNINEGDNGGPTFNVNGVVVGINSKMLNGLNHFIPASIVMRVLPRLYRGDVPTGWLGINPNNCADASALNKDWLLKDMAKEFLKKDAGVDLVVPKAGVIIMKVANPMIGDATLLRSGDVVIKANGHTLKDRQELIQYIAETVPGSTVTLQLIREDKLLSLKLRVGEFSWFVEPEPITPKEKF